MGFRFRRLGAVAAVVAVGMSATAQADTVHRSPGGAPRSIACTTARDCLAVAAVANSFQGNLVPITNGVPGAAVSFPALFVPAGISCMSANSCVVVGTQYSGSQEGASTRGGIIPVNNGSLGVERIVQGTSSLLGVACPTAGRCLSVGNVSGYSPQSGNYQYAVVVPIDNGQAGSPQAVNAPFLILSAIACESASSCTAVGEGRVHAGGSVSGVVVSIANGVPGSAQQVSGTTFLSGVGCPAGTSRCLASGELGNGNSSQGVLVPISGGIAGAAELVASTNSLWGVSCPSASVCVVGGVGGVETGVPISGGGIGSWHPVPSPGSYLTGIYCATETSCVTGGQEHTGGGVVIDIGSPPPATPAAAVNQSLAVSGSSATISAILSAGGYPAAVAAPSAGTLKIVWYYLPPGARLARAAKPVVVAQGSKSFASAGSAALKLRLTSAGRKLLKHSKRMKLIAVGSFAPRHGKRATKRKSITLKSH